MVTAGIFPFKENSHGRAGDRTRDLMVSTQRLWPLDHEAGQEAEKFATVFTIARHNYAFQLPCKVILPAVLMLYPDQDDKSPCHQSQLR